MSTIITGAIVIAAGATIFLLFVFINKKNAGRQIKALLNNINLAAATQGLTLSSQEVLKNKIISLDGQHKKLLILDFGDTETMVTINLADVKDCKLTREYEQVDFGSGKRSDIEHQLRSIGIMFSFKKRTGLFPLTFYDSKINSIYEMADLEKKAKDWEVLLSKLLTSDIMLRA